MCHEEECHSSLRLLELSSLTAFSNSISKLASLTAPPQVQRPEQEEIVEPPKIPVNPRKKTKKNQVLYDESEQKSKLPYPLNEVQVSQTFVVVVVPSEEGRKKGRS